MGLLIDGKGRIRTSWINGGRIVRSTVRRREQFHAGLFDNRLPIPVRLSVINGLVVTAAPARVASKLWNDSNRTTMCFRHYRTYYDGLLRHSLNSCLCWAYCSPTGRTACVTEIWPIVCAPVGDRRYAKTIKWTSPRHRQRQSANGSVFFGILVAVGDELKSRENNFDLCLAGGEKMANWPNIFATTQSLSTAASDHLRILSCWHSPIVVAG